MELCFLQMGWQVFLVQGEPEEQRPQAWNAGYIWTDEGADHLRSGPTSCLSALSEQ